MFFKASICGFIGVPPHKEVILISGPTHQTVSHHLVKMIPVVSAQEMYDVTHQYFKEVDIAILSAAVSDFKPKQVAAQKIKKADNTLTLELEKTKDILASLGKTKHQQFLVGFALETNNELKMQKQN